MNNMYVDEIPTKLSSLEKLQQIQIALEKILVMYKGQQRKIKGAMYLYNVIRHVINSLIYLIDLV